MCFSTFLSLAGNSGSPYLCKVQQPQEQCYVFLSVCVVFTCETMVWLPIFGIFNVCSDVDACDCTRGLYGHLSVDSLEVDSGRKSLAARGTRTRVIIISIAPRRCDAVEIV